MKFFCENSIKKNYFFSGGGGGSGRGRVSVSGGGGVRADVNEINGHCERTAGFCLLFDYSPYLH